MSDDHEHHRMDDDGGHSVHVQRHDRMRRKLLKLHKKLLKLHKKMVEAQQAFHALRSKMVEEGLIP